MFDNSPVVHLAKRNESAAVIHQVWTDEDIKGFHTCKVHIDSNLYSPELGKYSRGMFISIRKINFRKKSNDDCIDYLQIRFDRAETQKICGEFNVDEEIGHKSFFNDDNGNVTIQIHIDGSVPLSAKQRYLELELLFTAYDSKFSCLEKQTKYNSKFTIFRL